MYKHLTRSRIRAELAYHAYLVLGIIEIIICHVKKSVALPDTRGTRIPRLLGVRNYLKKYSAKYKRLTCSRIRVELAFPACLV